ncbi:hypothetical protein DH2020_000438 [Rehmannia glutinosa]|uniref:peroxidase n=1 Tax=Rehmannia glutinosa TaxID=99300 RepID=A0ABR0XX37_REHGL
MKKVYRGKLWELGFTSGGIVNDEQWRPPVSLEHRDATRHGIQMYILSSKSSSYLYVSLGFEAICHTSSTLTITFCMPRVVEEGGGAAAVVEEFSGAWSEFGLVVGAPHQCHGGDVPLQVGYYKGKCPLADVEAIVGGIVKAWYKRDPTIPAALLRMQFHDCFVNLFIQIFFKGCDASILLDGSNSEKTAVPNLSVRGYEIIDAAKSAVEAICPGVVSCADIIVMATRDAVALGGGGRYIVQTGRRDGNVSLAKNVDLPSPSILVSDSIKAFAKKGLNATDMVYLLGGHTVGITHCSLIQDRLYNFQNTGKPDPTMDSSLLSALRQRCPRNASVDSSVNLDQNPLSSMTVDNSYYRQIIMKRGILKIDQELALDPLSKPTVGAIANGFDFSTRFGQAMIKLGTVDVLTGKQGQIRSYCRAINKP